MTPQQLIQQQHAHQQAIHENEQFALAWLRATYEPCSDGKVDHQELYKHYMSSCSKIGRRGVISPLHFPRCVRYIYIYMFDGKRIILDSSCYLVSVTVSLQVGVWRDGGPEPDEAG